MFLNMNKQRKLVPLCSKYNLINKYIYKRVKKKRIIIYRGILYIERRE